MTDKVKLTEIKSIYEVSKITSVPAQIQNDFTNAVAMGLFKEFIGKMKNYEFILNAFLDAWEANIIGQKELELETLLNQQESMSDMVIGASILNAEDMELFKAEVAEFKEGVFEAVTAAIEEDTE